MSLRPRLTPSGSQSRLSQTDPAEHRPPTRSFSEIRPLNSTLWSVLLAASLGSPLDGGAATELRYSGTLTKAGRDADSQPLKRFNVYVLVSGAASERELAFLLDE